MAFCPKWVFEVACGAAAADFLSNEIDVSTVASAYSKVLAEFYEPISPDEFSQFIATALQFLDELSAGETAAPVLTGFSHNKATFEASNKPRKLRGLLGSADDPVKNREYGAAVAIKSFKAYVYSLRNNVVELAPLGWSLRNMDESLVLQKLADRSLNPLDFL